MLVILDSQYGDRVPVQIGTGVIDCAVKLITPDKLSKANDTWR